MKGLIVLILCLVLNLKVSDPNWELKKSGPGILVYTSESEGSHIKDIKATLNLNGTLSSVVSLVKDLPSYPKWIYNCSEGRVLKTLGDTELYFYQRIHAPWPVSDRDLCSHYKIRQNPQTLELSVISQAEPGLLPEIDGVVRVKKSKTLWKIKPISKDIMKGEYYLSFDPAGDVPVWLINMFISEGPYKSLLLLKQLINENPHKDKKYSFIKEFGT
jgi:ribosome-associated toxin RatA of RatAB toxin-antitoxin module